MSVSMTRGPILDPKYSMFLIWGLPTRGPLFLKSPYQTGRCKPGTEVVITGLGTPVPVHYPTLETIRYEDVVTDAVQNSEVIA